MAADCEGDHVWIGGSCAGCCYCASCRRSTSSSRTAGRSIQGKLMEPLAITGLLALLAGAIWVATRPPPAMPPSGGYVLQLRPIPISNKYLDALTRKNIIATSQIQLAALGYPVTRTDGVFDATTQAASTQFQKDSALAISAMQTALGRTDDGVELSVLDNLYRQKYGLPVLSV